MPVAVSRTYVPPATVTDVAGELLALIKVIDPAFGTVAVTF
jgi:hypothetical protein